MTPAHLETDPDKVLDAGGADGDPWAAALAADDHDRARTMFVDDLRTGPERTSLETDPIALRRRWFGVDPGEHAGFELDPDSIVAGNYVGAYGVEHGFEGGVDWYHNPTEADEHDFTPEWQWTLNRHYQWMALADAYEETGDTAYARAFEDELLSWIEHCPRPDGPGLAHPSAWRTIEAGIRVGTTWPYAFETFRRSADVSDEALWYWVCSFRDHGRHLLGHVMSNNWKTMESNGLTHVGAMFPELAGARTFLTTGIDRSVAELERQFYPDGLQHELAPRYGVLASLANIYSALALGDDCGGRLVPDRARERMGGVSEAYARLAAPDGRCPPLHDSTYLDVTQVYPEFADERVARGSGNAGAPPGENGDSDRRPWATGHPGRPPWESGRSDLLPWGGYGIVRRDGRYAMLDAGPYGAGHQHQDVLQILGFAGGEWLLVDPGSPQYTDSPVTDHLRSAAAHNVVLLDGERHEANPEVLVATEPPPVSVATGATVDATAAERSFETVDTDVTFDHERVLCDVDGMGWLVVDRLGPRDDRPHAFEWLWQTPGEVATGNDGTAVADGCEGGASLRIDPVGSRPSTTTVVRGERDPYRGWNATGQAADYEPLPTVRIESSEDAGGMEMVTLLSPASATVRDATFDERRRAVTVSNSREGIVLTLTDGDDGAVDAIETRRQDGTERLSLSEHALLAD